MDFPALWQIKEKQPFRVFFSTKKYKYKALIQGRWLRETPKMYFIRLTGNNAKAPTRIYFERSSGKYAFETYNIWSEYCWFPHLVKHRSEDASQMAKRKIILFRIQVKQAYKTDFNGENARNINVPVCIVGQICFI